MDIADFARQLLFQSDLALKLQTPATLTDERRGHGIGVPKAPARCQALTLKPRGSSQQTPFPSLRDLEDPTKRALVLHFFANHELLAMELMALALLRFPEAPAKFRRGLAAVIMEEQQHLRLYKQRMEDLGMGFGAVPVNRFFWDVMAGTPSPLIFITQMALTLEQANLDYSKHFLNLFRQLGDTVTADILDVVYQDETSHVAHGVTWFNAWRPSDGSSDWQAYSKLLPPPLTPARAKGIGFHPEARRSAGLSDEFIQELQVYAHSKGRPPNVYWFNPGCEDEAWAGITGQAARPEAKAVQQIRADLAGLMAFVATPQDVVLVQTRPQVEFLAGLQQLGFALPQFALDARELRGRLLGRFVPWGQSAAAQDFAQGMDLQWQTDIAAAPDGRLFAKTWSKELSLEAGFEPGGMKGGGSVCRELIATEQTIEALLAHGTVVVKAPYGTAGRGMLRVLAKDGVTTEQRRWFTGVLTRQGALIVEPWRQRVADFSLQINVANGERAEVGLTRFITNDRGQYTGHILGRKLDGLDPDLVRAYSEGDFPGIMSRVARTVGDKLAAAGYSGPAGIDALVYRGQGQGSYHLYPLVEVNPRLTMGRVAIALDRRVHAAAKCRWLHLPLERIRRRGWADGLTFTRAMQSAHPCQLRSGLLESGVMPTNDPASAQAMLTMLVAGEAALNEFVWTLLP